MQHVQVIQKMFRAITADETLKQKWQEFQHNFFENMKVERSNNTENICFLNFIFEFEIDSSNVLDLIIDKHSTDFEADEVEYLKALTKNTYSAYEVVEHKVGSEIIVTDLKEGKEVTIAESGSIDLEPGMIMYCRLAQLNGETKIIQMDGVSPAQVGYAVKRSIASASRVTSSGIVPSLFPRKEESSQPQNRTNPEKRLKKYLTKYMGKDLKWSELEKLKDADDKLEATKAYVQKHKKYFPEGDLGAIEQTVYNFASRGDGPGPIEQQIIHEHFREVREKYAQGMDKGEFPTDEEVQKFQKKWFGEKQPELGDKTPLEVIEAERTELGQKTDNMIPPVSFTQMKEQYELQERFNEANECVRNENVRGAIEILEKMAEDGVQAPQVLMQLATCHLDAGHKERDKDSLDRAAQLYQTILSTDPANRTAMKNLQLAHSLKSRVDLMKYEDEITKLDAKKLEATIKEFIPDFTKEEFDTLSTDAISAWEVYQAIASADRIKSEEPQKAEILLKAFWLQNKKGGFDFYELEKFVSERLSNFIFEDTDDKQKELADAMNDLQAKLEELEAPVRSKLTASFLQSFAFDFIVQTLPERILAMKTWAEKRFEMLDQMAMIWQRPEFTRQKAAIMIREGQIDRGEEILNELFGKGDMHAKIVLATSLNMSTDAKVKEKAATLAKEINKEYGKYNMTQDQAKEFMKQFKA